MNVFCHNRFLENKLPGWRIVIHAAPGKFSAKACSKLKMCKNMGVTERQSFLSACIRQCTGWTDFKTKTLYIKGDRPMFTITMTVLHEVAHVICGHEKTNIYHHKKFYAVYGKLVDDWEWER